MIVQNIIFVLFIHFLHFEFAKNSQLSVNKDSTELFKFFLPKIKKREVVNLKGFDDIKKAKKDNSSKNEDDVIYVCGGKEEVECSCNIKLKILDCHDFRLKAANVRPIIENFELQNIRFGSSRNLTLEKGKLFPGNEKTVKKLEFRFLKIFKIDHNIFDDFTSLEKLIFKHTLNLILDENILTEKLGKILLELEIYWSNNINLEIFKNLVNLEKLNLCRINQEYGTFYENFPSALSNLKFLQLESCNLTSLNYDIFKHLRSLKQLDLSGNRFQTIPSAINFLPNLVTFTMSFSSLKKVKTNDFAKNLNLKVINLFGNMDLKMVESCAFCNLEKSLKTVDFFQSKNLTFIDENAFGAISNKNGSTPKLKRFGIRECNVSVLHERMLDWKNVKFMDLLGNSFACNCSMGWLFNDLMSNTSIYEKKMHLEGFWFYNSYDLSQIGCLGPSLTTSNLSIIPSPTSPYRTFSQEIVETFSSCKKSFSF